MKIASRVLIVLAFAVAVTSEWGCTAPEHYRAAFASFEVGAYQGRASTDGSFRQGKDFDTSADNYGFFGSIHPFRYFEMQMQAEATARAITEAQYHVALKERECAPPPKTP